MPFCSAWIGDRDVAAGDRLLDLVAAFADDDDALVGAERIDPVEQVQEQRPAGDRMQHLVGVGAHARALPGGKDDDGETALVGHSGEQWHGAPASASAEPRAGAQKERAAPKDRPDLLSRRNGLEDVLIIFVSDEAHLLDVGPLGDRQHLVHQLVAGRRVGLQVQLGNRVHLLRHLEIGDAVGPW